MSRAWRRRSASCPSSEGGLFGERRASGNPGGCLSSSSCSEYPASLSCPVTTTKHDSGKPEWDNRRNGSADEPFNRKISPEVNNREAATASVTPPLARAQSPNRGARRHRGLERAVVQAREGDSQRGQRRAGGTGPVSAHCPPSAIVAERVGVDPRAQDFRTFVAERRRGDFGDSSLVRTPALSRVELESPRARGPYTAAGAFSTATGVRSDALQSKRKRSLAAYDGPPKPDSNPPVRR